MKLLTLENFKELQPYLAQADYNEYNSNIVTMLMWHNRYPVYYELFEHYALVYHKMPHRDPIWLMPYGDKQYRKEAIEMIKELSKQEHIAFEIHSMIQEFKDWLQHVYPHEFLIWDCYDVRDYVYDRLQQQSLAGKKMQKRRNHYHAFQRLYDQQYHYKPLEVSDIPNIYAFIAFWKQQKDEMDSIEAEEYGIHFLLEHMAVLPIIGGCIYVNGKLEAFSIASMVSKDTVQIHVEKANKAYRGLYIAILKLFLETLPDIVNYVNREDDMGLASLRKAKTDMQPVCKIKKYGCCHMPMSLRKAEKEDTQAIKRLWLDSFREENALTCDYYFEHFYQMEHTYLLTCEEGLIAMAQLRYLPIVLNQQELQIPLLFGVATKKEYQGCGYMRIMINHLKQQITSPYLLVQAYDWDLYRPFDFKDAYHLTRYKLKKEFYNKAPVDMIPAKASILTKLYYQYVNDKNGYRIRDDEYFIKHIAYASLFQQRYVIFMDHDSALGYVRLKETDEQLVITEFIYIHDIAKDLILSTLAQTPLPVIVYTDQMTEVEGRKKDELNMMVYTKDNAPYPTSLFMNEEL